MGSFRIVGIEQEEARGSSRTPGGGSSLLGMGGSTGSSAITHSKQENTYPEPGQSRFPIQENQTESQDESTPQDNQTQHEPYETTHWGQITERFST